MTDIHFLRPLWLSMAVLVPVVLALAWRWQPRPRAWRDICDAPLLAQLLVGGGDGGRRLRFLLAGLFGIVGAVALAGPSWLAAEMPIERLLTARIVALDLSRSMDVRDVSPSRLEVARAKASAVLARTGQHQAGLVLFAGDGFEIAPLTTDAASLIGLLPAFDTQVVPLQGSRPDLGLERARELLRRGAPAGGEIVLITDGAKGRAAVSTAARLWQDGIRVSVLAVGTRAGGRIPLAGGGSVREMDGSWVVAATPIDLLEAIARAGGGRFARATTDDSDLDALLAPAGPPGSPAELVATGRRAHHWRDAGVWLLPLLLVIAASSFRRGWLFSCLVAGFTMSVEPPAAAQSPASGAERPAVVTGAGAGEWRWLAIEMYRAGRYREAAALFGNGDRPDDHYNRGNALALAGLLRGALAAYGEAIARDGDHEDAHFNLALVRGLLDDEAEGEENRRRPLSTENLETSGDGRAGDGRGEGARNTETGADRDAEAGGNVRDKSGEAEDEPAASGDVARRTRLETDAEAERSRMPSPRQLTPEEIEGMEETLQRIEEERLTLWQRKLMQRWRVRGRRPPPVSSAW